MFSKEWKLAAFSLLAAVVLTACPNNKKKDSQNPFTGYWVNAAAYDQLAAAGAGQNPGICHAINNHPHRWGIRPDPYGQQLLLDAWLISGNGTVYLYSPGLTQMPVSARNMYLMGHISGSAFSPKNGVQSGAYGAYSGYQGFYGGPFSRRIPQTTVRYQDNFLIAYSPGPYGIYQSVPYVKVGAEQLVQMSQVVSYCTGVVTFDRQPLGMQQGPPIAMQQQPQLRPYMVAPPMPTSGVPPNSQMGPFVPPQNFGNGYPYQEQNPDQRQDEQAYQRQPLNQNQK